MTYTTDIPPSRDDLNENLPINTTCKSNASMGILGHQEFFRNVGNLHNVSSVRSRGYNVGNLVIGLTPDSKDGFYTQPGSPYNNTDNTTGMVKRYTKSNPKNDKWKKRLMTKEEKRIELKQHKKSAGYIMRLIREDLKTPRDQAVLNRSGGF